MDEIIDFTHRTKLRKVRLSKKKFVKKDFVLQSSVWDIKNHSIGDDMDAFEKLILKGD